MAPTVGRPRGQFLHVPPFKAWTLRERGVSCSMVPEGELRKLDHCRIISRSSISFPTLRAYPPPPVEPERKPPPPARRLPAPPTPSPTPSPPVHSRSYRLLHDCMFLPDFDLVEKFVEARRHMRSARSGAPKERSHEREILAIGLLVTFLPPLGVTLLWGSRRFSSTAKAAITGYAAFTLLLAAGTMFALLR